MPAKTLTFKKIRFTNPYKRFQSNFKRDAEDLPKAEAAFTRRRAISSMRPAPKKPKQSGGRFGYAKAYTARTYAKRVQKYGHNTPKTYWRKGLYSRPGTPPFYHGYNFDLRSIVFRPLSTSPGIPHVNPRNGRVLAWVVGPMMGQKNYKIPVPKLQEYGGKVSIGQQAREYTDRGWTMQRGAGGGDVMLYPPRPYMRPAAAEARVSVQAKLGGSIPRLTKLGNVHKTHGIAAQDLLMSGNITQAGAAYEAILVDKVTQPADKIIQSLARLEAAFNQIQGPANDFNAAMSGIATSMKTMSTSAKLRSENVFNKIGNAMFLAAGVTTTAAQSIGQSMIHVGLAFERAGYIATTASASIGAFLFKSAKAFSDSQEVMQSFGDVFGASAERVKAWAQDYSKAMGLSATSTMDMLVSYRAFFSTLGLGSDTLDEMSKRVLQATVDLAAARNMSTSDAYTKISSGLAGEIEPLRRYGILVDDATLGNSEFAKTLGKTTAEMSQQEKQLGRFVLILEGLDRIKATGRGAAETESLPRQIEKLGAAIKGFMEKVGKSVINDIIDLLKRLTAFFESLSASSEAVERVKQLMFFLGALGGTLLFAGKLMRNLGIAVIAAGTSIATFVFLAASLIKAIPTLMSVLAWFGPGGLIVLGLAAFGAAVAAVLFITEFPIMKAFERLKDMIVTLGEYAQEFFTILKGAFLQGNYEDIWIGFKAAGILAAVEIGSAMFQILSDALKAAFAGAQEYFSRMMLAIVPGFMAKGIGYDPEKQQKSQEAFAVRMVKYIAEQRQILAELNRKYETKTKEASEFFTGKQRSPDDYGPVGDAVAEAVAEAVTGQMRSIVTSSAIVAGAAGDFGPSTEAKAIEEEVKQSALLEKIAASTLKTANILGQSEPVVFGN